MNCSGSRNNTFNRKIEESSQYNRSKVSENLHITLIDWLGVVMYRKPVH